MSLHLVLALALVTQAPPDSGSAHPADTLVAGAYLDSVAAELVGRARARQQLDTRQIQGYRTVARERMSVGLRAFGRERLLFRGEGAARVEWERNAPARVQMLGWRQVAPVAFRDPQTDAVDEISARVDELAFDPDQGWILGVPSGADQGGSVGFIHPLARGSEAHYRYRSGDSTTIRLPDGEAIRLVELQVAPRRSAHRLLSGSLWLDSETAAVVRGAFRFTVPFAIGASSDKGQWGLAGDFGVVLVEYGRWAGRWWLPRLITMEGSATLGSMTLPMRMERSYEGYELFTEPAGAGRPESPAPWADSVLAASYETHADTAATCGDERRTRADGCRRVEIWIPKDRTALLDNEFLPPSIYADGEALATEAEIRQAARTIYSSDHLAALLARPRVQWTPLDPILFHYNRVEGATLGTSARVALGNLSVAGAAWLGTADRSLGLRTGVTRMRSGRTERVGVYRRLDAFSPDDRPFGLGNSLSALAFGSDLGDYYRTLGVEAEATSMATEGLIYAWRLYAERQTAAEQHTDFSLSKVLGDDGFRPNPVADEADQVGVAGSVRLNRGLDPDAWRSAIEIGVVGEAGSYSFIRPLADGFVGFPLPGPFVGAIEAGAGTTIGEAPVQRLWYLGGSATIRGIGASSRVAGEAFWRGRAEVATAFPGVRLVGFGDAGWAGARNAWTLDPPLISAGVGASFLDGLVRFDLARVLRGGSGWRLEFHLGGPL